MRDVIKKKVEIFDIADLKTVFIDGVALAAAGVLVGNPKLIK